MFVRLVPPLLFFFLSISTSNAQQLEWGAGLNIDFGGFGYDIAYDSSGNVYSVGCFQDTIDLDPGPGTAFFASAGELDVYIVKLDSAGNYVWGKTVGSTFNDRGLGVNVDPSGNACITGRFDATVDFDPGPGVYNLASVGYSDVFVLKLDPNGDFLWAVSMGAPFMTQLRGRDEGNAIVNDKLGNIYVCGRLEGTADFDPGPGVTNVSTVGGYDIFLMKLDPAGNLCWAKGVGSGTSDIGYDIALDSSANVYATGYFGGTADFDPGPGIYNLAPTGGGSDAFMLKLDSAGNFLQAYKVTGSPGGTGQGITADINENVYVTGSFTSTGDFDPGPGTNSLTSVGGTDVFITKIDSSGNGVWAKNFGGSSSDIAFDIAVDDLNNVYTTGMFRQIVDFDPGPGTWLVNASGFSNVFVSKLDASGNFIWAHGMGSNSSDQGLAIHVDMNRNIFGGGDFIDTIDVDPGIGVSLLTSSISARDPYVFKWSQCSTNGIPDSVTVCGSYTWAANNATYTSSGTYLATISGSGGCDSLATLNLTVLPSSAGTDFQAACDSFTWMDGNTYTSSTNTPVWTLTNAQGCDSVVNLDLTILTTSLGTDVQTACDSFTWMDGNTYTSSTNTPVWTLTNVQGCDSVVTLDLTINQADNSVSQNGNTLTANATGASYQWLDCDNSFATISGENNQSFAPTVNGNYAVAVTENGCVDTSACFPITGVGVIENGFGDGLLLYPNPSDDNFFINLGETCDSPELMIWDVSGKMVMHQIYTKAQILNLEFAAPAGLYMVEIRSSDKRALIKLVKE